MARSDSDGVPFIIRIKEEHNIVSNFLNLIISFAICNLLVMELDTFIVAEFLVLVTCNYHLYKFLYVFMNKYFKSFRDISPEHKKYYVIKNFVKSLTLAWLFVVTLMNYEDIIYGTYELTFIKRCAVYYSLNDVIGLFVVDKLPATTVVHHTMTSLCTLCVQFKKSSKLDVISLVIIYAIFSSAAFCVNFYLGLRIYAGCEYVKKVLSITSFWIYVLNCVVNWGVQLYLSFILFHDCLVRTYDLLANYVMCLYCSEYPSYENVDYVLLAQLLMYIAFFVAVAKDDVILMKWLFNDFQSFSKKTN
ncbi:MAG: hypothetical protein Gaeavirus11_10 [Gaeavirus sp.]|uniref:TLC domain-containing protein n=1 Tax=Gaeavirus sp. TaxID=2487767 RepID=A0A3G4ZZ46_9VIRU|nr:MAG: hypothetical protein Gaeavirus11_10 [Gaeavirus sp.]